MRIDAYNQISQMYQSTKVKPVKGVKKAANTDVFEVSQAGKDYQTATQAVKEVADIREDKVNKIKEALESGKIIIANVQGGEFNPSNGGHYIVLTEMIGEEVSVYDPGNRLNTKSFPMETVTKNISNGIWIFE